ncbi:MAG TPA: hypothetical protein VHJ58_14930 [Vicinamibacterales bacterium]|nr:hypothetical protein [Vicinamibacterales bacterium]
MQEPDAIRERVRTAKVARLATTDPEAVMAESEKLWIPQNIDTVFDTWPRPEVAIAERVPVSHGLTN